MLTRKQNLLETIRGGSPDRFVNQYEYMALISDPITMGALGPLAPGTTWKNGWGVTVTYPEGAPGAIPLHDGEVTVLKDITQWKEIVKAPRVEYSDGEWAPIVEAFSKIDRDEMFVAPFFAPGLFEKLHYLMGMKETMYNFYDEPELMHELIEFLTEHELASAKEICKHVSPDALFHHDDWGSNTSSMLSPDMFKEFFLEPYKRIYKFWKDNGVQIVVHHSDSYGANLVPHMIEMGIDIWQGCVSNNDLPALIKQYGGKISFQGGIDSTAVDKRDWDGEEIAKLVEGLCRSCGKHYIIPCQTMGGPYSSYNGVYTAISENIDRMSGLMF